MATAKTRAVRKYNEKAYDRIELKVPKGDKEKIKAFVGKGSLNAFINEAIREKMNPASSTPTSAVEKKPEQPLSGSKGVYYPPRYFEEEWDSYLLLTKERHSPEAIADAREDMRKILYPKNSEAPNIKTKQQYICPFTGKKFGSMDNLIRAAIPKVIKSSEGDIARESFNKKKAEDLARLEQLMNERKKGRG